MVLLFSWRSYSNCLFSDQPFLTFYSLNKNYWMLRVFILALAAVCTLTANYITVVNSTEGIAEMERLCSSAPISDLNMCNNTCLECVASNSRKCAYCHEQFNLVNQDCVLDDNFHNYTYLSYLHQSNTQMMATSLQEFIYGDISTHILINKVIQVCQDNSYEMFMAGPFKRTNIVGLNYRLVDPIDQIQIKFNFMSFVQDMGVYVDINDINIFTKKFAIFSDLVGRYSKKPNNAGPNYVVLNALTFDNVGSVVQPVDTGIFYLINNTLRIRIGIDSQEDGYTWALSDVVIIMRACETCPTKDLLYVIDRVRTFAGIIFGSVVGMLLLLFLMIKAEQLYRRREVEQRMGSANNIPLKAINRVIFKIQALRHTMEKDHYEQEKMHRRSMQQYASSRLVKRND